ncbi:acyl-[acyl-carrier-protein]--UDP-N-acetylglucosamine O-acyltransferase [Planctomycetales bacterium]|nr:acyl-[acyl-carrier-protein]--UDP-N-acetylglucosamine O-acyltransferase [Planctomycetales bacterium]GHS97262.1 acyl-[acyl-carrier-protein]--UDP-N-acetylglucosamine O-acyltransferase [Planctomycetales bacterium]GHT05731.1 acyl-[acyl-carrier-protein]--UDP-N-acetylglucosamine O-acyltransferase [Planctomycetales bacterium]
MTKIHPTAVIAPSAEIADEVEIGAYCYIGDHVKIGRGTIIEPQARVLIHTTIGERNKISSGAVIGGAPQDVGYKGEPTEIFIGDDNTIREFVTINRGTTKQDRKTVIGNDNLLMAYVHIAHDDVIGDHCIFANMTQLAGHVTFGDGVVTSAGVLVHQFVHIGKYCFLAPSATVNSDALPGCIYFGHPAEARAINVVGLQRHGVTGAQLGHFKTAFKKIVRSEATTLDAIAELEKEDWASEPMVAEFIAAAKQKGAGAKGRGGAAEF